MLFCLRRPSLYIYIYKNIMNKWTLLALVATSFTAQAQQLTNAKFRQCIGMNVSLTLAKW